LPVVLQRQEVSGTGTTITRCGAMRLSTLKQSGEFKRVRGGARATCPAFIIEARARVAGAETNSSDGPDDLARFGFTITKKIGGAVERNRIRRRLKEAVRALQPGLVKAGHDYVVVARRAALTDRFEDLVSALHLTIEKMHRPHAERPAGDRPHGPAKGKGPRVARGQGSEGRDDAGSSGRSDSR
jgi:ribonuclease P protein component